MTAAASDWLTPEEAAAWLRTPVSSRRWRMPVYRYGQERAKWRVRIWWQGERRDWLGRAVSGGRSARGPQCGEIDEHLVVNDRQQPRARGHDVAGKACELVRVVGQPLLR